METDLQAPVISVSDFVAVLNQSLEYIFGEVNIVGELANYRVSKGKWVYFDLKDDQATVKFFGTVYQIPGPLENGMMLRVSGCPRLHNNYGFSVNVRSIRPIGEGSIRRAADLLKLKLQNEGLFDESRKRPLPYPPSSIGLIASMQSAAYADFIKVLSARWRGLNINIIDVQVQGDVAINQIVNAIEQFNLDTTHNIETIVLVRGGGSPEDLAAFNSEQVTRAISTSRLPTLVAIGHEVDICLAELAADRRASTPSNAAELLVPDRNQVVKRLDEHLNDLDFYSSSHLKAAIVTNNLAVQSLDGIISQIIKKRHHLLDQQQTLLKAYDPQAILKRGYAIARLHNQIIRNQQTLNIGDILNVQLIDFDFDAQVIKINKELS